MSRNRFSILVAVAAIAVAVFAFASPASGAPIDQVNQTILQAQAANNEVLNRFATRALSATSADELKTYRIQADNELESIYYAAMDQLDSLEAANPDLSSEISQARSTILNDHNDAHAEVKFIYQEVLQGLLNGTTTTTTVPNTTTTTVPRTTTTTVPKATTTTVPKTTTTTVPRTTTTVSDTTTTTEPDTTTTTEAIAGGGDDGRGGSDGSGGRSGDGAPGDQQGATEPPPDETATVIAAPVSVAGGDTGSVTDTDEGMAMRMERGMVSGMLESSASVVLPPSIARFTAAPFIVLEVLFSTLFESAQALLVPFLVLMATVAWFLWRETRRPSGATSG